MAERITHVELQARGKKQTFEINHAERILRMTNNGGWQLPVGSAFEFSLKNGIKQRENKRTGKKPNKKANNI
jgi:hypothetical protein